MNFHDTGLIQQTSITSTADKILCLALDVGEGMLKSGGEINRVEDTIGRICRAYGAAHVEIFAIPSVIIAAIRMKNGEYSSQVRRIDSIGNNLYQLELYNGISRNICKNPCPLAEFDHMIHEAKKKRAFPTWVRILASGVAAGSFALFFGGGIFDGIAAFVIGMIVAFIDLIPFKQINRLSKIVMQSFIGGALACLSVDIGLGKNDGMIMIGTIMLLIPGLSFGTAFRDLLCGDFLAGSLKTVQCILAAIMIAAGYLLAMFVLGGLA